MSLFERKTFDAMLGAWPGVRFVDQWDSHVAKVGDKCLRCLASGMTGGLSSNARKKVSKSSHRWRALPRHPISPTQMGVDQRSFSAGRQELGALRPPLLRTRGGGADEEAAHRTWHRAGEVRAKDARDHALLRRYPRPIGEDPRQQLRLSALTRQLARSSH